MQPGQEGARESIVPTASTPDLPAFLLPTDGQLALPTSEQFELILAEAARSGKLPDLQKAVAALEAMAKKFDLAFEEILRLAVFRLRTERALGAYLAQTVKRGGDRAKYPRGTLPHGLPDWVDKKRSSAFQKLAAIPDAVFESYLLEVGSLRRVPSALGARRFAGKPASVKSRQRGKSTGCKPSKALMDACVRVLGGIDVVVGAPEVKGVAHLGERDAVSPKLRGRVLVVQSAEVDAAVRQISKLRCSGAVEEAIVLLPRDLDHRGFTALCAGPWTCCIPSQPGEPIVAHIGAHARGFSLIFAKTGVVMDVRAELAEG